MATPERNDVLASLPIDLKTRERSMYWIICMTEYKAEYEKR